MAAVPAVVNSRSASTRALSAQLRLAPKPAPTSSEKLQKSLDGLFPDMMVEGTRSYLLNVTTSLTKASSRAHDYFSRVSHMLAFERMMRSFMQLTAAVSPFPMNAMAANCWNGMFMPGGKGAPSAWGLPSASAQPVNPALAFFSNAMQPQPAAPNAMQAWGLPASTQQSNPLSLFAGMFEQQKTASSQNQPWSDYNGLLIVPMIYLAAAPSPESWWNFGL
jgi:hypothetical protein